MSAALMDIDQVAEYLGISKQSIYSTRSRGENTYPPAISVGRKLRWRKSSVDAWLDEQEKASQMKRGS